MKQFIREPGRYEVTLKDIIDKPSKAGNPMLTLAFVDSQGREIADWCLMANQYGPRKLVNFTKAVAPTVPSAQVEEAIKVALKFGGPAAVREKFTKFIGKPLVVNVAFQEPKPGTVVDPKKPKYTTITSYEAVGAEQF